MLFDWQNGGIPTPDRRGQSRPPSFVGGGSPVQLRSRSSTSDSLRSGSSPNSGANGPHSSLFPNAAIPICVTPSSTVSTSTINTVASHLSSANSSVVSNRKCSPQTASGSLKKRVAPLPPPSSETSDKLSVTSHIRNFSDSGVSLPAQRTSKSRGSIPSRKSLVTDYATSDKKNVASFNHQSATHLRKFDSRHLRCCWWM